VLEAQEDADGTKRQLLDLLCLRRVEQKEL
jgi:hypothetical protein